MKPIINFIFSIGHRCYAQDFLNKFNFDCIEIGAVMPHYNYIAKLVIDPRDDYQNCYKINALDYSYFNENVLSISTIEHFKIDEFNRTDYDSITCLCKIINESKNYLITWPIGYNKILDYFRERRFKSA